jgi:hypothetical protein
MRLGIRIEICTQGSAMDCFTSQTIEQLRCYVYALVDPRVASGQPERVFYVGKGQGNRCFQHAKANVEGMEFHSMPNKLQFIEQIRAATGNPPIVEIVAHGLSEVEALRLEGVLIKAIPGLSNQVGGHRSEDLWLEAREVEARYGEPISVAKLPKPLLLVSLNGSKQDNLPAYPEIHGDAEALARRTLGNWPLKPVQAKHVKLVLGVYRGLVRTVFKPELTSEGFALFDVITPAKKRAHRRVRFVGKQDEDLANQLFARAISDATGELLTVFEPKSSRRLVST